MSEPTTPQTSELLQLDPAELIIGENVRLDPRLDKQFIASIRERGVLQPIHGYRNTDGQITVAYGQRRTLAAREAGRTSVPVLVCATPPDGADLLVDQWVENEHRAGLTNGEKIAAVEQMALAGLSEAQIAKRTATKRADIKAARTVADSTVRDHADQLTLAQAAALAEFDDDAEAVAQLVAAAEVGQFDHTAEQLREQRAEQAQVAALADQARAEGLTVIDEPGWADDAPTRNLAHLADSDGQPLTDDGHRECPGHAVSVTVRHGWGGQPDSYSLTTHCTDPATHGHQSRWTGGSSSPTRKQSEDMTDTEREQAKTERRHVIESNKAWKAATEVRRAWLAEFAARKTAPQGAEVYLAAAIAGDWYCLKQQDVTSRQLAGFSTAADDEGKSWEMNAAMQDAAVSAATHAASPKHALQIAVRLTVAAWEGATSKDTWRSYGTDTTTTLAALARWGYQLSDIEQTMINSHDTDD